jgi:ANTAR domain
VELFQLQHEEGPCLECFQTGLPVAEQLQGALNSRVAIEQAKGILAEHLGLDMGQAFELLRGQARAQSRRLAELAGAVASGAEDVTSWETVRRFRSG